MVRLNHRPHFCHNHIDSYLVVIQCVYSETLTDYISHTCKRKKKSYDYRYLMLFGFLPKVSFGPSLRKASISHKTNLAMCNGCEIFVQVCTLLSKHFVLLVKRCVTHLGL